MAQRPDDPFPHGRLEDLLRRQEGVVTRVQLLEHGLDDADVRRLVRRGRLLRLRRGAYLLDPGRDTGRNLRVQARAATLVVPEAVVAGATAARLWGLDGVPDGAVEVAVPPQRGLRTRPDLRPHAWTLTPGDVELLRGIPVTTPARTLADVVPTLGRPAALAVLDSALRTGACTTEELLQVGAATRGRPGSAHVADLWAKADGRAESVLESRVRLRCLDAGLPPDELQVEVRDGEGRVVARADLGYRRRSRPGRGMLLVEADGAEVHSRLGAVLQDRSRANQLTAMGFDIIRFTWRDTLDELTVPRMLLAAL